MATCCSPTYGLHLADRGARAPRNGSLLNEYFTIMVECIQREGGMLDKSSGDAIMAAFASLWPMTTTRTGRCGQPLP